MKINTFFKCWAPDCYFESTNLSESLKHRHKDAVDITTETDE